MTARLPLGAAARALALLALLPAGANAQFGEGKAVGQFYRVEPPLSVDRSFFGVRVERVAPNSLAMPPPLDVIPVGVPIRALTGQITELPQRGRIYFTILDSAGALRLIELDLIRREARVVSPPAGAPMPYAAQLLVTSSGSKLYVQWFGPGYIPETYIYDGFSLALLGRTSQFLPDERAAGFEARDPYLWTLDFSNRPVLVDAQRDRVETAFDYQRWFGQVRAVVSDAWRDVLLYRLDVGRDRYQLVDVRSGEVGPPLDLEGYGSVQPRLAQSGRLLVLIDMERRPLRNATRYAETAIALGGGTIYDLRARRRAGEFRLVVPYDLPVSALGTTDDPGLPGRLWVHASGDAQRIDFDMPGCARGTGGGDRLDARLEASWDASEDPGLYRYGVRVADDSEGAVGALAIEAGRLTDRSGAPEGWGMDLIKRESWIRWTNALGPADEDVAPGEAKGGFVISAERDTRPGIAEYRIQAAIGLPRGCESDSRFLKNSLRGYTIAPERVDTIDPRKRAQRLERLVRKACEISWVDPAGCEALRPLAREIVESRSGRAANLERFLDAVASIRMETTASTVLRDAARSIKQILDPLP